MPRPQFTLKRMLWLMAVVAACLVAWSRLRPPLFLDDPGKAFHDRFYGWENGTVFILTHEEGDWLPGISIQNGVDVESFFTSADSEAPRSGGPK